MNIIFYESSGLTKSKNLERMAKAIGAKYRTYDYFLNHGLDNATYHVVQGILGPSTHIIREAQRSNKKFIYLDYGYFKTRHPRDRWYRVHVNKFHGAQWYNWGLVRRKNFRKFDRMCLKEWKEWTKKGDHILVCPPTPAVTEFFNQHTWLDNTLAQLKTYTDRPIVVRHKPHAVNVHWETQCLVNSKTVTEHEEKMPLKDQLENCWAMVTYNSVTAIDAVYAGVPVFSGPECITHLLGNTNLVNIENPVYNSQAPFFWSTAEFQYSKSELFNAMTWEDIIRQGG
jgi:hypothetical protein